MNQQSTNILKRNNQNNSRASEYPSILGSRSNNSVSGNSSSKIIGIIVLVVVLVLLIVACYWLYTMYSNRQFQTTVETEVMPDVKDASSIFNIGNGSIPTSTYSNEYSISMWINVDNYNYNYGKEKIILRRGDKGAGNPEILLDAKTNDLIVRLKLQNNNGNIINMNMNMNKNSSGSSSSSGSSVSNFADIPKNVIETNMKTNGGCGYSSKSLNDIGSNLIDYPTIQYQQSQRNQNDNNELLMVNMQPTNITTLMLEHDELVKEGFNVNEKFVNETSTSTQPSTTLPSQTMTKTENNANTDASSIIQNITETDPTVGTCIYRAFPLQKWVHLVVSVYNQVVDIFIDGQLASSCMLKAFPAVSTSNVVITPDGGFAGKISRVVFSNTAMTVPHAKELYYAGPVKSDSLLSQIPSWLWYGLILIIILAIVISFFI